MEILVKKMTSQYPIEYNAKEAEKKTSTMTKSQ